MSTPISGSLTLSGSVTGLPDDIWRLDLCPMLGVTASVGTWVFGGSTSQFNGGYYYNSSAAQNDAISWDVGLSAGTWSLDILGLTFTSRGIITAEIDGTSVGTADFYAASVGYNVVKTISGISVATSGQHTLKFLAATKNASSTGYQMLLSAISLYRTA